ncbi:MAG: hypothetical protein ABI068_15855, partial [Ktedonobacterales bacterium]
RMPSRLRIRHDFHRRLDAVFSLTNDQLAARAEIGLMALALLANFFLLPHRIGFDAGYRFTALQQLLAGGGFSNTKYSLIGYLPAIPLLLLGRVIMSPAWWFARYNALLLAAALPAFYWLLRERLDDAIVRAFLLILLLASMFPYHLMLAYSEVFTALCVGIGVLVAVPPTGAANSSGGRQIALREFVGWGLIVVGVANTPATLVGLLAVVVARCLQVRRWRYLLAIVAALALIGAEAWLRRGSPFASGYANNGGDQTVMPFSGLPGFSYPFLFGLLSILFSFGKGLIFFMPGLLLPLGIAGLKSRRTTRAGGRLPPDAQKAVRSEGQSRRQGTSVPVRSALRLFKTESGAPTAQAESGASLPSIYTLWLVFVVGLVVGYAKWWAWYGGWFWGPRFFLFACIPASLALALWLRRPPRSFWPKLAALLILALSCWVGVNGVLFDQRTLQVCQAHDYALEALCYYTPEYSVLWRPLVILYQVGWGRFFSIEPTSTGQLAYAAFALLVGCWLAVPTLTELGSQTWRWASAALPSWRTTIAAWRF